MIDAIIAVKKIKERLAVSEQLTASFGDVDDLDEQERDELCFENGKVRAYEESIYELEKLNHIPDTGKMVERKLKPVDENCRFKPVYSPLEDNVFTLIDIEKDTVGNHKCINYFVYSNSKRLVRYRDVIRITDYDYGDGGNYEI